MGRPTVQELGLHDFRAMPIREATDEAARKFRMKHLRKQHERKAVAAAAAMSGRADETEEAVENL